MDTQDVQESENVVRENGSWMPIVLVLLLALGSYLVWNSVSSINRIREALATEVLAQQNDVEKLISSYTDVLLALEMQRRQPGERAWSLLNQSLLSAQEQLGRMRQNYTFERLDGAARAHAFVNPIIEDVTDWLLDGVATYSSQNPIVLELAYRRLYERFEALKGISEETHAVASELIDDQETDLGSFRNTLLLQLLAFISLASVVIFLLYRHRLLQQRIVLGQQRSARRFRDFAAIGADWFWETDADMRLTSDTNFLELEDGSEAVPSSRDHSNGVSLSQRLLPLQKMRERKAFSNYECQLISDDGATRDLSISAWPMFSSKREFIGYRGVGSDITQRKDIERRLEQASADLVQAEAIGRMKAEAALTASEQFLRTTIDSLPQKILILDNERLIVETNRALEQSGNRIEDSSSRWSWKGRKVRAFFQAQPPMEFSEGVVSDLESLVAKLESVTKGKSRAFRVEYATHEGDNRCVYVMRVQPLESANECFALVLIEDVTAARNLAEQDRRLRSELAHAARLSTAGELASGLAHELNQPLTAISHNCDALGLILQSSSQINGEVGGTFAEMIDDLVKESQRAGDIIRSMRQMVQNDCQEFTAVDLNTLVRETLRLTKPEVRENRINVALSLASGLPHVLINPVQVQQVLVNLERNGVEAIVSSDASDRSLHIQTDLMDSRFVRISVADSGPGFSDQIQRNLFASFQSTKENGMGLGLSLSRTIVESHGGKIWLDSTGQPTRICFTLPCVQSQ